MSGVINYELLKTAKISDIDLAGLAGVSKAAANHWRTGRGAPHPLRLPKLQRLMDLIQTAVDSGTLPVEQTGSPAERLTKIKTVLRQYVNV